MAGETKESTGAELALVEQAVLISPEIGQAELEQIRDIMSGAVEYELPETDTGAITADVLNRLLFAEDEQQLLAEVPTWSSKDNVGRRFRILPNGRLWPSKFENKDTGQKGAFASIQAIDVETGEVGVLNTSSPYIVGKVAWYARYGGLPAVFQVVVRGESAGGYSILDIEKD